MQRLLSAANIKAIKDAITTAKLASSTATANDGDKVKFSGIASGDTKYDNLKLTVTAAYKGTMEAVLTVDVDATKQIVFKLPVTVIIRRLYLQKLQVCGLKILFLFA